MHGHMNVKCCNISKLLIVSKYTEAFRCPHSQKLGALPTAKNLEH